MLAAINLVEDEGSKGKSGAIVTAAAAAAATAASIISIRMSLLLLQPAEKCGSIKAGCLRRVCRLQIRYITLTESVTFLSPQSFALAPNEQSRLI